jgi:predicted nucleic acid-binding protein
MPTGASASTLLVDTSVAVALVVTDHEHHDATSRSLGRRRLGLAGHAAYETFSVLTRLPAPARRTPRTVVRLLAGGFPESKFLGASTAASLFAELEALGVAGGAVYDALVGAVATEHRLRLATRDRRALETYRALDVNVELLG